MRNNPNPAYRKDEPYPNYLQYLRPHHVIRKRYVNNKGKVKTRTRTYNLYLCTLCGNKAVILKDNVKSNNNKSCGCLVKISGKRHLLKINKLVKEGKLVRNSGAKKGSVYKSTNRDKVNVYPDITKRERVTYVDKNGVKITKRTNKGSKWLLPEDADKYLNELWSQDVA